MLATGPSISLPLSKLSVITASGMNAFVFYMTEILEYVS